MFHCLFSGVIDNGNCTCRVEEGVHMTRLSADSAHGDVWLGGGGGGLLWQGFCFYIVCSEINPLSAAIFSYIPTAVLSILFNPFSASKLVHLNKIYILLFILKMNKCTQISVVKIIQIWQNGAQRFSYIVDWCHVSSLTCLKGGTPWDNKK